MTLKDIGLGQTYLSIFKKTDEIKTFQPRLCYVQDKRPVVKPSSNVGSTVKYLEIIKQLFPK